MQWRRSEPPQRFLRNRGASLDRRAAHCGNRCNGANHGIRWVRFIRLGAIRQADGGCHGELRTICHMNGPIVWLRGSRSARCAGRQTRPHRMVRSTSVDETVAQGLVAVFHGESTEPLRTQWSAHRNRTGFGQTKQAGAWRKITIDGYVACRKQDAVAALAGSRTRPAEPPS